MSEEPGKWVMDIPYKGQLNHDERAKPGKVFYKNKKAEGQRIDNQLEQLELNHDERAELSLSVGQPGGPQCP